MYYIYAGFFFCIIFYFGSTIKEALLYYSSFNNKYLGIGNPWFFALLFINILILSFIYYFYHNKSGIRNIGNIGPIGYTGRKGDSGEPYVYC
jgi:hypothetical protein